MTRHPRRQSGFTLVELLMVIAIMAILTGLLVIAGNQVRNSTRKKQTLTMLTQLQAAAEEYEIETGRRINHFNRTAPVGTILHETFDWTESKEKNDPPTTTGTGTIDDSIERFLYVVLRIDRTSYLLPKVDSDDEDVLYDQDGDGFLEMFDAFGTRIEYAESVLHGTDLNGDDYGSDDFLPERKTPFFASAGSDADFGDAETDDPTKDPMRDNVYSYDLP